MTAANRAERVIFVGTYRVRGGQAQAWIDANRDMTEFVQANEPRVLSFDTFLSSDGSEATTIHVHVDSASLERHLRLAAERIAGSAQTVEVLRIDLYGDPSPELVDRLRAMSSWPVYVKRHAGGFGRVPP